MNVLYPSETLQDAKEVITIISTNNIQNEANNPSDEFLQFLHFNLSFIIELYLQQNQQYDQNFYLNVEYIFNSNCDDIKIIMSTDEQLLNFIFYFLQKESKQTSSLIRGRFCKVLGQILLLSDIDYISHITKYKTLSVFFNNKSELRDCGGILFLILLVSNIQFMPFFDLIYDIIKSHTYSALTFFEENFFTQILLNKLATTNKNSIISSLYSPITFSDEKPEEKSEEKKQFFTKSTIEIKNIGETDDDSAYSNIINNNVLKILMYLTCNLSRSSSLVIPLLKKETILTLLDASLNEEKFQIFSAFQLITSLHKQSNQISREAIESINGRLPKICETIMSNKSTEGSKNQPLKSTEIALITLFSSIINDIYGVAGESIPEPINYKMKKSVHLSDSLELFHIREKARTTKKSVSKSQEAYFIDNSSDICEEEEEEESEWLYGDFDTSGNGGSNAEDEVEVPMNLNEFRRKKFPVIENDLYNHEQEEKETKQEKQDQPNQSEMDKTNREKKKNIPQIPNFSQVTHHHYHHHHHKSRHSTSILTYKDLEVSSHSGSNSGRIYKKKSDTFAFKNGIINISKGFTASSGCGRLSIKQQPNNNSNENFYQKVSWMSNEKLQRPKTEDDKFVITPTSSSSSSSRLELPKLEIPSTLSQINEEDENQKSIQQKQQKQTLQQIHQQIQYNYSFSDTHIIHAPESEVSPVTKDPKTGENLSLMDFANQAPSNPQIDLIFHQRTKSCNSIDYKNATNNRNVSEYSLSNDLAEDENISLLDLANSANSFKATKNSLPMYNGQYGAPPVSDLYPLLQSTPVFFNNALSPRESSSSIQSYSSRADINKEPISEILSIPHKSNDYTSSFNSTNSASFSNSNSSDIDATAASSALAAIATISENEEEEQKTITKDTLVSFPTSPSAKNGNQLTNLNLQNLSNNSTANSSNNNRSRHSLSHISPGFGNLFLIDENRNNDLNSELNNLGGLNYHYPNSARPTRPSFLPSTCFTIQEDPTEQQISSSVADGEKENEEEEVGEEEDEESEAELPDKTETTENEIESIAEDKEKEEINENNEKGEKIETKIDLENESNETDKKEENDEKDEAEEIKLNCNDSPIKTKKNKNHILNESKKKNELIIQTTCFLIDRFFENPYNSFLHNSLIDLIKTIYRFTRLTSAIFNRSKILHRIIELYQKGKILKLPFSGHIHKLVEIAQKLNLRISKYVRKKNRSKPKEFLIFESDEWKDYLENVFNYETEIMKKNYGGFYSELYLIMKDSKERVLRPDL